jgi:hypothetical protein
VTFYASPEAPLIGLCGYARSGKDTVGSALVDAFGYRRMAFADALRGLVAAVDPLVGHDGGIPVRYLEAVREHGYEGAKRLYPEVRRFLQAMGAEGARATFGPNAWVDVLARRLDSVGDGATVITDVRFPNEAAFIRSRGGLVAQVLREVRVMDHESERPDLLRPSMYLDNAGRLDRVPRLASQAHAAAVAYAGIPGDL